MRFLADESCDMAVIVALRSAGHDVLAVAEIARGAEDGDVIALAGQDQRVLLAEDKASVSSSSLPRRKVLASY